MLKQITETQRKQIDNYLEHMTLDEKCAQVQCVNLGGKTDEQILDLFRNYTVGAVFCGNMTRKRFMEIEKLFKHSHFPLLVCGDFVNGIGCRLEGFTQFPQQMACSAANDTALIEQMGEITALEGRSSGINWTFGPVSDLCYTPQNSMMHIRTSGDDPDHVLAVSSAFIKGVQKNSYMAATAKHFPGDGIDERDTHITTLINPLSRSQWERTYGHIWRSMIDQGVMCVMSGHIALPCIDSDYHDNSQPYKGFQPASLSKKILIDFLRGELGFDGLIVSDAINMIGLSAHMKRTEYAERLLSAGNDMLLWTIPDLDTPQIKSALERGTLTMDRLNSAVRHVLELKARIGLFESSSVQLAPITEQQFKLHSTVAQKMADESIVVYRDAFHAIPCRDLRKGSRILTISITFVEGIRGKRDGAELDVIDEMLRERGFIVDHMVNPGGMELLCNICDDYDKIFVNFKYPAKFGSIRLCGDAIAAFKGSWWVDNPKVIFTSFGDPFKIFDLPCLHSYIAAFSMRETSQRAAVKVWLGEIEAKGKMPVALDRWLQPQLVQLPDLSHSASFGLEEFV